MFSFSCKSHMHVLFCVSLNDFHPWRNRRSNRIRETSRRPWWDQLSQIMMSDPRGLLWLLTVLGPNGDEHLVFACKVSRFYPERDLDSEVRLEMKGARRRKRASVWVKEMEREHFKDHLDGNADLFLMTDTHLPLFAFRIPSRIRIHISVHPFPPSAMFRSSVYPHIRYRQ